MRFLAHKSASRLEAVRRSRQTPPRLVMFHGKHPHPQKAGGRLAPSARYLSRLATAALTVANRCRPSPAGATAPSSLRTIHRHPQSRLQTKAAMFPVKHRRLRARVFRRAPPAWSWRNYRRIGITSQTVRSSPGCLRMQIPSLSWRCSSIFSSRQTLATSMR